MMTDDELGQIIDEYVNQGFGSDLGDQSQFRRELDDRYKGERYGNEPENESAVTTREVFETVEWAMPSVMSHFASADIPVEFIPENMEDKQGAKIETQAVHNCYHKDNPGFVRSYQGVKSVLLNPNGYVKVSREKADRVVFEHYSGVTLEDIAYIEDDDQLELIEAEEMEKDPEHINDPTITFQGQQRYNVKVKRKLTRGRNIVSVLPEDEVVIDNNWHQPDLEDCPFVCHYPEKTQTELMLMGMPEDLLDEIYNSGNHDSAEQTDRENLSDETLNMEESHKAMRLFTYHECFMLVDYDGDGIAERRRVVKVNDHIWENEEDDEQPIISAASILQPHRHTGISLAETVIDLQEISTAIMRQTLNNMYRSNKPRIKVTKGANLADVLADRTNGILRMNNLDDVGIEQTAPIIGQVLPLMDMIEQTKEYRSGISKQNTAPSANTMRDMAEGSFLEMVERADQRTALMARLIGEMLFKPIYLKLHALIKKHGDLYDMEFEGQWIQTDPTNWRNRYDMKVKIGLGTGSRQQKRVAAQVITQDHNYLIENGAIADPMTGAKGLITWDNIYAGRRLMTEALGEDVNQFYFNPAMIPPRPPAPPPPDPNMLLIQSNERIEGQKRQVDVMRIQADQMAKRIDIESKRALEYRQLEMDELNGALKARINELELELKVAGQDDKALAEQRKLELDSVKAQLNDVNQDEDRALKRYQVELENETKILLEKMRLGVEAVDQVQNLADGQNQTMAQQQQITQALTNLSTMINEMRQPKEIVYDDDGEIVGSRNMETGEVRPIRRDSQGNPIGT